MSLTLFIRTWRNAETLYEEEYEGDIRSKNISRQSRRWENNIRSIKKDQIVFSQGNEADAVFYIQKGKIKLTVVSERGKEAVVGILEPGHFLGEGCLNGHPLRVATATAIDQCLITRIPKAEMIATLHDRAGIFRIVHGGFVESEQSN